MSAHMNEPWMGCERQAEEIAKTMKRLGYRLDNPYLGDAVERAKARKGNPGARRGAFVDPDALRKEIKDPRTPKRIKKLLLEKIDRFADIYEYGESVNWDRDRVIRYASRRFSEERSTAPTRRILETMYDDGSLRVASREYAEFKDLHKPRQTEMFRSENPKSKVVRRKAKKKSSITEKERRELEEYLRKYDLEKVREAELKGNPHLKTKRGYDPFGIHGDFGESHGPPLYYIEDGEAVFDDYYLGSLDSLAEDLGYYDIAKPAAKFYDDSGSSDYTALDVLVAAKSAPASTLRQLSKEFDQLAKLHRDNEKDSEAMAYAADTMRRAAKDAGGRQRGNPSKKKLTKIPMGVEIKRLPPGKAEGAELPGEFAGGSHEGKHPGGRKRKQRPLAMGLGVRAFGTSNPKKAKTPEWERLIKHCQKLWESYCERPSKKRLRLVLAHLEKMKESTSAKVKSERSRCLRAAKAEAKSLKMKL